MDDVRKVAGYSTQKKCRVLMSQLYQYAIKREMASTDYSRYVEIDRHHPVYKKRPFTVREINRLWRASDSDVVQDVLILIYTGLRIGEYLALRPQDIKIRERYLDIRHSKTEAGIRRVPISKKILPFLEARKDRRSICLSPTYDSFRRRFDSTLKQLSMHHSPHECRHTLASMLDSAGVNDTTVKMILGHARRGVTKAVYTHKTFSIVPNSLSRTRGKFCQFIDSSRPSSASSEQLILEIGCYADDPHLLIQRQDSSLWFD